jgi:O-antigen/teichoic acid export membrane protein
MSAVRRNVIAGYAGSIWTGLMSLVFIPVYVQLIGIEAYGLVGFFLTLQSMFAVLDLGLSTTLNREFARLSAFPAAQIDQRRLLRTIETIYWAIAFLNAAVVIACARPISASWLQREELPLPVVVQAVMTMGVVLLFQWPLSMYSGGLLGLQKQVSLNIINAGMATLRGVGAILALWLVAPTLQVFFAWQVIVSALHTGTVAVVLRRAIGGTSGSSFDFSVLASVWRFAGGLVGISVISTGITQVDKLVVSRLLPLTDLGYYTLAGAVALSIYRIISPLFASLFPRFSQLVAAGEESALAALYHRSCETLAVVVLPAAVFLAFFSREVLVLWTQDPLMAEQTHVIMTILVIGTAMNGLMTLPYAVQLAYGWTRLAFTYNAISVVIMFPAAYLLTRAWGAVGASVGWMVYNAVGVLLLPLLMHRRVLKGEQGRFYRTDIGMPLAAAVGAATCARLVITDTATLSSMELMALLLAAAAVIQAASATATPTTRGWLSSALQSTRA